MAFTVLACCKSHCSFYFLEPCRRVCGSELGASVFVFQATITALCAPAWRRNQSSRLPRQKSPVLSAENPDMNWPCQIPVRGKKSIFFNQSKGAGFPFLATRSWSKSDWATESFLFSWVFPPSRFLPWRWDSRPGIPFSSLGVHTHFLNLFLSQTARM